MTRGLLLAAALMLAALPSWREARAQDIVADLTDHLIAINTGFTGTRVVLFGALEGEGDIAVVVRGPPRTVTIREKARTLGVWINHQSMTFSGVPSYYSVATSAPIDQLADDTVLARHAIGLDHLPITPVDADGLDPELVAAFESALIRQMQGEDLYVLATEPVSFLSGRLFRTTLAIPANVPTGQYAVEVYLLRDGQVVGAQTTPLIVTKVGVGANISAFARDDAALYGLISVLLAAGAGWFASAVFRRA